MVAANPSEKWWSESQLGWWHSQSMESHKIHVPNHQPIHHHDMGFLSKREKTWKKTEITLCFILDIDMFRKKWRKKPEKPWNNPGKTLKSSENTPEMWLGDLLFHLGCHCRLHQPGRPYEKAAFWEVVMEKCQFLWILLVYNVIYIYYII